MQIKHQNCYLLLMLISAGETMLLTVLITMTSAVKEATLTNEKLRKIVIQQQTVVSDQSLRITHLQQDLTSTRSSLSQLSAEREYRDTEKDQLISSLQLQLQAVSRRLLLMKLLVI